jgi:ubiquinone biosynthesis protein UbiJ
MLAPATVVIPLLNHLLEREDWARQRLQAFSGQTAQIEGGPIQLVMTVDDTGIFRAATLKEVPTVTISFGAEAPIKLLTEPASLFASARLTGAANFAETLAFVFRNLRWDYEADLAGVIGDIPARRLARLLADGVNWHRSAAQRAGANIAEYATEESALVTPGRDLVSFANEVDRLRDDLARLEKRVSRLLP